MKKKLLVLFLLGICSFGYSRVMLQADITMPAVTYSASLNDVNVNPFGGVYGSVGWEFNTDDLDSKLHYFAALDGGYYFYGISLGLQGGLSYTIATTGNLLFELKPALTLGAVEEWWESLDIYNKLSCDVVLSSASRRGCYTGIGLQFLSTIPAKNIASDFNIQGGMRISLGWRI